LRGITVILYETTQTGVNGFNEPIYSETPVEVENVLVAPASEQEILTATNLYGKKVTYTLGIPKGDTHEWEDKKVAFFGKTFKAFGIPTEGIEHLIPLAWNKKVMVELYE